MPTMAARISEFHSRPRSHSLLQTRSLRDLQAPPPQAPLPAEKSRRRLMQVHAVREVPPPVPGPDVSSRARLVQMPSEPQSPPLNSSFQQLSPFIAAPRASFETVSMKTTSSSCTPSRAQKSQTATYNTSDRVRCSIATRPATSPAPALSPGLRDPPIDPRRSRRYCNEFDLGRKKFKPSTVARSSSSSTTFADNSSLASTPLAMYTETDSDSDTSSADYSLGFTFPEPPPIDETLHIRRMQSSPMFYSEERDTIKQLLRKRYAATAQVSVSNAATRDIYDSIGDFSYLNSDLEAELDIASSQLAAKCSPLSRADVSPQTLFSTPKNLGHSKLTDEPLTSNLKDATFTSATHHKQIRPASEKGYSDAWKRATVTTTPTEYWPKRGGSSLLHRQSMSSRKEKSSRYDTSKPFVNTPTQVPKHLPAELAEPMDRLDMSIKKLKLHDPQQHQTNRSVVTIHSELRQGIKSSTSLSFAPPSLASAGRQKPIYRSTALTPPRTADSDHNYSSRNLGPPFNHRSIYSHSVPPSSRADQRPVPKSFIDITPEQEVERPRSHMRKLLARASFGVIGWGKNLGRKKSCIEMKRS